MSKHGFEAFTLAGQQDTARFGLDISAPFPLALKPANGWEPTLEELIQLTKGLSKSGELFGRVNRHGGAVLVRGLPITSPQDYSDMAHAFGFPAHEEVGRPPLRGETPIIPSMGLAAALKERVPEFVDKLLQGRVKYVYRYGVEDVKSNTGTSVIGAYGQHVKADDDKETVRKKIEEQVRRHSDRFKWHEDGSLSVTHTVSIIRKHNEIGLPTWFGNLTKYGDGTPIEKKYFDLALALAESLQVSIEWQNYAIMHSRSSWTGKRTVLAGLWDYSRTRIGDYPRNTAK
ncbi:Clavaminate synthase-like protein [Hypoxylon cercidicola]|nr:Clavaminate synthase-like protein [Hypoxylon cercidicola]